MQVEMATLSRKFSRHAVDFDVDGKADEAVYRSELENGWIKPSSGTHLTEPVGVETPLTSLSGGIMTVTERRTSPPIGPTTAAGISCLPRVLPLTVSAGGRS